MKNVLFALLLAGLPGFALGSDASPLPDPAQLKQIEKLQQLPLDATTAYGDALVPDADIDDESNEADRNEQYRRGRMAFLFGQYKVAMKYWEPLAISGYAKAQATLGWIYHTGKGAKKNLEKARYWYTRAANQSHEIALNNLGVFYEKGLGVGKNYQKARDYYRASANLGYRFAQYNLGMMYLSGHGVKVNKDKAIYWLENASYQGVDQAKEELKALGRAVDIPQHKSIQAGDENKPGWKKNHYQQKPGNHPRFHGKPHKAGSEPKP